MSREPTPRWTSRAIEGLLVLLAVAFGVHTADRWLHPLVPTIIVLVVLGILMRLLFRGRP